MSWYTDEKVHSDDCWKEIKDLQEKVKELEGDHAEMFACKMAMEGIVEKAEAKAEAMQKALEKIVKRGAICPYFIAEQALKDKPTGGDDAN